MLDTKPYDRTQANPILASLCRKGTFSSPSFLEKRFPTRWRHDSLGSSVPSAAIVSSLTSDGVVEASSEDSEAYKDESTLGL